MFREKYVLTFHIQLLPFFCFSFFSLWGPICHVIKINTSLKFKRYIFKVYFDFSFINNLLLNMILGLQDKYGLSNTRGPNLRNSKEIFLRDFYDIDATMY